ncbi:MAG: hypothetical protein ThorAB25_25280 [Candidatus Thorarchaeota archaeon AB_25]|nr:MAG: hypothetical protein ThorAB25_25280 [Candidatus Thorarchaeota archaeon AB_25]
MQFEWIIGIAAMGIAAIILLVFIVFIVSFLIQGIVLGVGLGFVNGQNRNISSTMVTSLLMALVIWIPCLGCFIAWYFIKSRHEVGWGGALVAWLLGGIITILVMVLLLMFVFTGFWAAIIGGLIPPLP